MSWASQQVLLNTTARDVPSNLHATLKTMNRIPIDGYDQRLLWFLDCERLLSWKVGQLAAVNKAWSLLRHRPLLKPLATAAPILCRLKLAFGGRRLGPLGNTGIRFECSQLNIERVENFAESFDNFWNATKDNYGVTMERSSVFLNWRHINTPRILGKSFAFACIDSGRLLGYLVVRQSVNTAPGHFIVTDLFYDAHRPQVLHNLMNKAFALAEAEGGSVFEVFGFHPMLYKELANQSPYVLRRHDLELLGRTTSGLRLASGLMPGGTKAPSSTYWYRVPTRELADVCLRESWWPSGVDGDLNL